MSYIRYCCVVLKVMINWRNKAGLKGMQYINAHSGSVPPAPLSSLFFSAVENMYKGSIPRLGEVVL